MTRFDPARLTRLHTEQVLARVDDPRLRYVRAISSDVQGSSSATG